MEKHPNEEPGWSGLLADIIVGENLSEVLEYLPCFWLACLAFIMLFMNENERVFALQQYITYVCNDIFHPGERKIRIFNWQEALWQFSDWKQFSTLQFDRNKKDGPGPGPGLSPFP